MNFLIVTILNQSTDMLSSTSYLKNSFLLKHSWIQFIRFEFILVIAVSEHIVFTHTPWIDFIFVGDNGICVVASWIDISDFLLLIIIDNVIFESKVPKELISSWTSKVANSTKIFLLGILSLFNWLAALYSLPWLLCELFLYLLLIIWLLLTFNLIGIGVTFFIIIGLFFVFHGFLLLLLLFSSLFLFFLQSFVFGFLCSVLAVDVANSNLTFIVSSKAVNTARLEEHNCVMLSTYNLNDMVSLVRIEVLNFLCISNRLFVTKTKLSVIIHAPCINLVRII